MEMLSPEATGGISMPAPRIVIIGAASAYTPGIIESLIVEAATTLTGWDVVLMDIDQPRLQTIWRLAKQMVKAAGVSLGVTMTLDRRVALKGANFVLTQMRVGGLTARALDERLPQKYGLIGQETVGAGGLGFAWRTIPVMLEIAREMRELCPNAWLINYANPTRQVTEALLRDGTFTRVIGLCDEPGGVLAELAKVLRVSPDRINADNYGINHCGWLCNVTLDGRPLLPRLRTFARFVPVTLLKGWEARIVVQLLRRYGALASPYLGYFYLREERLAHQRRARQTRAEVIMDQLPDIYAHYDEQAGAARPHLTKRRGFPVHGDLAVSVIAAIVGDRRVRQIVNIPGQGMMPGFPPSTVVELVAEVGANGATPLSVPPPDESLTRLVRTVRLAEDLNIEAALTGSVDKAVAAMVAHPLVGPASARALTFDLLAAHRQYTPQFPH